MHSLLRPLFCLTLLSAAALPARAQDAVDPPAAVPTPPTADPAKAIEKLDGTRYRLGPITFDKSARTVSFAARVNMREGSLEYGIVHEAGKAHESLLTTRISPFDLNVVLLLVNCKPCEAWFDRSDPERGSVATVDPEVNPEAPMDVLLAWKDADGKEQSARLESWVVNLEKGAPAPDGPFIYTGSFLLNDGRFMAQEDGSILALYTDAAAVFNNPRQGRENDDIWIPNKDRIPPKGTEITVTLRPVAPAKAGKSAPPADSPRKPAAGGR